MPQFVVLYINRFGVIISGERVTSMFTEERHTAARARKTMTAETTVAGMSDDGRISPAARRLSRAERQVQGQGIRSTVPRSAHATWMAPTNRADPIALLEAQAASRVPELVPIRHARMRASMFAFLRGSPILMAHDLAQSPTTGIRTQLCGDAHISNFGLYASPERHLVFDINDFDETLAGPWEWDVKRLAVSCHVAGRQNAFSESDCSAAVVAAVESYRRRMAEYAAMRELDIWYAHVTADDLLALIKTKATRRKAQGMVVKTQQHDSMRARSKLTEVVDGRRVIANVPPLIERISDAEESGRLGHLFAHYVQTLRESQRHVLGRFHIVDFARKVVGVGSVGTRCFILMLAGSEDDDVLFLQVKEAQSSVLEGLLPRSRFTQHGKRVVVGQELMQATSDLFLGWLHGDDGCDYYVRQLWDMKGAVKVEALSPSELALWASACGWALARAHARAGDAAAIAGYLGANAVFDRAIVAFAKSYADQTERDYQAFLSAIDMGRLIAASEG